LGCAGFAPVHFPPCGPGVVAHEPRCSGAARDHCHRRVATMIDDRDAGHCPQYHGWSRRGGGGAGLSQPGAGCRAGGTGGLAAGAACLVGSRTYRAVVSKCHVDGSFEVTAPDRPTLNLLVPQEVALSFLSLRHGDVASEHRM
jgi:hypothetical protein